MEIIKYRYLFISMENSKLLFFLNWSNQILLFFISGKYKISNIHFFWKIQILEN